MGYPIFHSQYTAAQIEAAIGKGPRVNASGYWEVWNIETSAYESTGVGAGVTPPTVVTQVSQMRNHGYVYIYNGSEDGYTPGYWYYWNGNAWTAGGAYQVAATDPTLSVAGAAADAKAVGDILRETTEATRNLWIWGDQTVTGDKTVFAAPTGAGIPAGTYTMSAEIERDAVANCRMVFYHGKPVTTAGQIANVYIASGSRGSVTVTLSDTADIVHVYSGPSPTSTHEAIWHNIQLEAGETATPYVPPVTAKDAIAREGVEKIDSSYLGRREGVGDLGITALSECSQAGWYDFTAAYAGSITDLPEDFSTTWSGCLLVIADAFTSASLQILFNRAVASRLNSAWTRIVQGSTVSNWRRMARSENTMEYVGGLADLGVTELQKLKDCGWYTFTSAYAASITDLPQGFSGGGIVEVVHPSFAGFSYRHIRLINVAGDEWTCLTQTSPDRVYRDWRLQCGPSKDKLYGLTALSGKTVAILGDSISTNGNYNPETNPYGNVPEIVVGEEDVGVQLSAYVTFWDVWNNTAKTDSTDLTIGGHQFTDAEIGTEVTFTPTAEDVGKMVGKPANYNSASIKTWWEHAAEALGFTPIAVCWSGSSITSHEANVDRLKTSYAWHEAQIRKCGIRTPGSMQRTAPDVIIVKRGGNDFSHSPYAVADMTHANAYPGKYPETDLLEDGTYGLVEGMQLTVKKLREAYPLAQIVFCTLNVLKRVIYSSYPTRNGTNTLPQYSAVIRETAQALGCHLIEFDKDGITFENCYIGGYITDSATTPTHPSNKGHAVMGERAILDLRKLNGMG